MSSTLHQSAVASRQVSVESESSFGDPFAQLDQVMNNDKDNDCAGQNTDASPCDQAPAVFTIAPVSKGQDFNNNRKCILTDLGKDTHKSVESSG